MSNNLSHYSDSYKHLRKFPINIQSAICLVASVLRRRMAEQEQSDIADAKNLVKQK